MKKNKIIKIIIVLLILAVIAVIFFMVLSSKVPTTVYTIESDDGTAKLEIPKSALPEAISPDRISITVIKSGETNDTDEKRPIVSYRLEPDGLVFTKPAKATFALKNIKEGSVPIAAMTSKGEVEFLANQRVEIDAASKSAVITGDVTHFSYVTLHRAFFVIEMTDVTDHIVGDSFDVEGIVDIEKTSYIFSQDVSQTTTYTLTSYPEVWGSLRNVFKAAVSPEFIVDFPARGTKIPEVGRIKNTARFTCVEAGAGQLTYVVRIENAGYEWRQKRGGRADDLDEIRQQILSVDVAYSGNSFSCQTGGLSGSESQDIGDILDLRRSPDPSGLACPGADYLSPDSGGVILGVYKLKDGKCYPVEQFGVGSSPDECAETHFHRQITSLDGTTRSDSQPCGAAKYTDILNLDRITIYVNPAQMNQINAR